MWQSHAGALWKLLGHCWLPSGSREMSRFVKLLGDGRKREVERQREEESEIEIEWVCVRKRESKRECGRKDSTKIRKIVYLL